MLTSEYPPNIKGGLGTHVAGLAPALVRAGIEVHLITPHPASIEVSAETPAIDRELEVTKEGVVIHRVPRLEATGDVFDQARRSNQAMLARGCELLADDGCFEIIHAHDWLVVFAAQALKHQFRLPLIATIHATEQGRSLDGTLQTDLQRNIDGAERWLAHEAWRVITCSQHMAGEVQTCFHISPDKIDVVPNGINPYLNGHRTQPAKADCRPPYAVADRQVVFSIGRLVYEKGLHLLIEAVPYILAEFPDTQFIVAGRGPEGANLCQQAEDIGVAGNVYFPGFISDEERDCLYHAANCAVFPSLYEPFGIVALEAMIAGCPVVVSEIGGLREFVRHDKTGVTIYPDDPQSVAWGIMSIIRDPARAAARARKAELVARRDYSWDAIATRTIAVYQRVVDERKRIEW
jgi:glycosyltransferase involved in cell wall biosynthesis